MADNYDQYSKEELLRLLRERDRKPRFGLVWERNEIEHDKSLNDDFVALDLDPSLSSGDAPYENIIIEGDNFDALRYLRMTHAGRVKCIYIDPPYNTGNRDFIYNDRFIDPEDSYRHSKWLEFLYRRIVLAKDLLRDDGVLLVSINDENRAKLELLLDQILPGMRIGSFTWRSRLGDNRPKGAYLSVNHEHVLVYANSGFRFRGNDKTFDMYSNPDKDINGPWRASDLTGPASWKERPNTYYPIQDPITKVWYPCNPDRVWVYATEDRIDDQTVLRKGTMESYIRAGRVIFPRGKRVAIWNTRKELDDAILSGDVPKDGNGNPLLRQDLPSDVLTYFIRKSVGWGIPTYKRYQADAKETVQPISSWIKSTADKETEDSNEMTTGLTDEGSKVLRQQIGTKIFQFPKPPSLMKELVLQSSSGDDLVMDFFAGSGTTAYAVELANAVDGGNRRYVLVSSTEATDEEPEKNVCRDVCAVRLRNTNSNFAYLRTKRISASRVFNDIQHEQVWRALQLIHGVPMTDYVRRSLVHLAGEGSNRLAYVPKLSEAVLEEVVKLTRLAGRLVVYSWQPGQIKQRVDAPNVAFEKIPEFLVSRFGGRK